MATKQINQYTAAITVDGAADYLLIDPGGTGTYKKINRNVLLGITSTPIGASDSQTLQNKTLDNTNIITVKDGNFTVQNTADTTKRAVLSAAGITTGTTRTLTMPNRSDTLVTLAGSETLTNKTITSPTITGGTIDNAALTVDSISGHTSATQVTVGGVLMNNGTIGTSGAVVAASVAAGAIQPQGLTASTGTSWAYTSWSPVPANLTIGNGTVIAKSIQVGKTMHFYYSLTFGTTTAVTGAGPTIPLPVNNSANYNTVIAAVGLYPIGVGNVSHAGNYATTIALAAGNVFKWVALNASGTYTQPADISATVPATFATGDIWTAVGSYEVA